MTDIEKLAKMMLENLDAGKLILVRKNIKALKILIAEKEK